MAYNILGICPGHNGSVALVSDGELLLYIEEERLSRQKYDGNPFRGMIQVLSNWKVDELVIVGTTNEHPLLTWTEENPYTALTRKFYPNVKTIFLGHQHHLTHAASAFYNSGFEEAICIVIDGAGSYREEVVDEENKISLKGYETESIWICEYPNKFQLMYKVLASNNSHKYFNGIYDFDNAATLTKAYEAVTHYLGFGFIEAGKTMGLSAYGQEDRQNVPKIFLGNRADKNFIIPSYPAGAFIDFARYSNFQQQTNPTEWHQNPEKISDIEKNLAWHVQKETEELLIHYVHNTISKTPIKNIVISGGYGLNCVANYKLLKTFPDINFYFEPIAHDGGTSLGAAKLLWHSKEDQLDHTIRPQTTLYYGPSYSLETLKNVLNDNAEKIKTQKVSHKDIAKLISKRNIVALFQGRSEAGPRALGNRSILYDPRDPDGKAIVNIIKGREWFRPFAGSCLEEELQNWFDTGGLKSSPFMMLAMNVAADKIEQIPCITHVDGTCRVQSVNEEQNENYYKLIKEFYNITNVPILFNTSFNLAGDPLVETLNEALDTLYRSKLKYLYLPELSLLVTKIISDPETEKIEVADELVEE